MGLSLGLYTETGNDRELLSSQLLLKRLRFGRIPSNGCASCLHCLDIAPTQAEPIVSKLCSPKMRQCVLQEYFGFQFYRKIRHPL